MGWISRRRARRSAELAAAVAAALREGQSQESAPITLLKVVNEITDIQLKRFKLEEELDIKRLEATAADREADRKEIRDQKERAKAARAQAAEHARDVRKRGSTLRSIGSGPQFMADCEDCRAGLEGRQPAHNRDMIKHASHLPHYRAFMAARNGAPGGEKNAATN